MKSSILFHIVNNVQVGSSLSGGLILIFSLFLFVLSGCYFRGSITNLNSDLPPAPFSKITSMENVSGSNGYQVTPVRGFLIKQSVGLLLNKQVASTPNGYRAYLHVSGRLTSEELNK